MPRGRGATRPSRGLGARDGERPFKREEAAIGQHVTRRGPLQTQCQDAHACQSNPSERPLCAAIRPAPTDLDKAGPHSVQGYQSRLQANLCSPGRLRTLKPPACAVLLDRTRTESRHGPDSRKRSRKTHGNGKLRCRGVERMRCGLPRSSIPSTRYSLSQ